MPDIFLVIARRWSLIILLTLAGTASAYVASLLSPKLYLGTTTALPANSLTNDKARIFNSNVEALYSEFGPVEELDKIEGTARLDTVFLAVAAAHHLAAHYNFDTEADNALERAAQLLRKSSDISRTGYGELKIKVWDKNNEMAATLANALLQTINAIYERLQTENNKMVLQKLKETYSQKFGELAAIEEKAATVKTTPKVHGLESKQTIDSAAKKSEQFAETIFSTTEGRKQLQDYLRLINEYELAVKTTPKALLVVEQARPPAGYDRPKTARNILLAFLASLFFSFLLAAFVESRQTRI